MATIAAPHGSYFNYFIDILTIKMISSRVLTMFACSSSYVNIKMAIDFSKDQ